MQSHLRSQIADIKAYALPPSDGRSITAMVISKASVRMFAKREGNMGGAPEAALDRLISFIAEARELDPLMPAQELHVLLVIAAKRRMSQRRLADETGLSRPSVSRNVSALGTYHRNGKAGLGLVAQVPDRFDNRAEELFLTSKGREVVRKLLEAATGEPAGSFSPPTVR